MARLIGDKHELPTLGENFMKRLSRLLLILSLTAVFFTTSHAQDANIDTLRAADVNADGTVDILDLTLIASHFNETVAEDQTPDPDINDDGLVNILDLTLVASHFGKTVPTDFEADIDFDAEEQAIRDHFGVYVRAHSDKDLDVLGDVWLKSEENTVFIAWTFWAGTFDHNEGAKAVSKGWADIFRLHGGTMEVDITYIGIDSQGEEAVLRGKYVWGNQRGDLIAALKKEDSDWKIRAIDYTNGEFGELVTDLIDPAYTFGEISEE